MYRLFLKEVDESRGHRIGDYEKIANAREEALNLLSSMPEGTQAYVRRQSWDEDSGYWGPIRPVEAYMVRDGEVKIIYTRYKGGEWPLLWTYSQGDYQLTERGKAISLLKRMGYKGSEKEVRNTLKEFEGIDWKDLERDFISKGPGTSPRRGEGGK